jgi:ribosomal protein S18 acetylase RimI-like enzyme
VPSPEIRLAKPSERDLLLRILTLAFAQDPATRWLYKTADRYLEHFPTFSNAFGMKALDHDTAWVADDLSGASLWFPPGVHPDGDALAAMIQATTPEEEHGQIFEAFGQMDQYHPKEPHWYLAVLGADPARQGQGTGSALLRTTLAKVDEQNLPAYLESSNIANVPLYERHGFEVAGKIQSDDGPLITPMFRPAR